MKGQRKGKELRNRESDRKTCRIDRRPVVTVHPFMRGCMACLTVCFLDERRLNGV